MTTTTCLPFMLPKKERFICGYQMGETLGRGVFGKVKMVTHPTTGERLAVKIMDRNDYRDDVMKSFEKEVVALSKLSGNKHIVHLSFYGYYDYPAKYMAFRKVRAAVMAMEPVAMDLQQLLTTSGPFSFHVSTDLFIQLMRALDFCHSRGVCHRDIKPSNILISEEYRLLLADFGMAHIGGKDCHKVCGTQRYMAPEIVHTIPDCYDGVKCDVWSAAVCYLRLLTLKYPFYMAAKFDPMFRMLDDEEWDAYWRLPEWKDMICGRARHLLSLLLKTDPIRRPTSAQVVEYLDKKLYEE